MIILNCDGSLMTEGTPERAASQGHDRGTRGSVAQQPDLIDRIFTFAFDVLDLQTIDLTIRPVSMAGHPD